MRKMERKKEREREMKRKRGREKESERLRNRNGRPQRVMKCPNQHAIKLLPKVVCHH